MLGLSEQVGSDELAVAGLVGEDNELGDTGHEDHGSAWVRSRSRPVCALTS